MHWTHFPEPASIFALAALPAGGCLAATAQGLWQYTAQSRAWGAIAPQFAEVPLTAVAAHGPTWLIGSNGDIAVSRDCGATWGVSTLPVRAQVLGVAMSSAFERDGLALAATAKDGVLRSTDHGTTWHAWNYGLLDLGVNAIALSPHFERDTTCFAATDHAIFTSTNGGRAWQELGAPMDAGPYTALAFSDSGSPKALLAGSEGSGVLSSSEPFDVWQRVKGLRAAEINYMLPGLVASTSGLYTINGSKWRKLSDNDGIVALAALDDGTLVAGTAGDGVWHARPA